MKKYVCDPCGYVYDPEAGDPDNGIAPGTAFEDLPEEIVELKAMWNTQSKNPALQQVISLLRS